MPFKFGDYEFQKDFVHFLESKYKFADLADKFVAFYHSYKFSEMAILTDRAEHYVNLLKCRVVKLKL